MSVWVKIYGLTHTFPDDIDLLLVGPGGQNAIIMSDVGGSTAVSNVSFTIADGNPAIAGYWSAGQRGDLRTKQCRNRRHVLGSGTCAFRQRSPVDLQRGESEWNLEPVCNR